MTVVEGSVESIGMSPLSGLLTARVARFRPSGGVLFAPESVPYPIVAGQVSADLAPGPAQLTVQVGSHARERFDVVIPDEGPVSLASLVEEAFPWEPEQVAEFVRLRDEAQRAADDARDWAESFDLSVTSAQVGPDVPSSATLTGDGPVYALHLALSKGLKGDKGDPGEVTTAELNAGLATKADLVGGQVPTSQLPAVALTKPFPVADRAAMLALTAEEGDVAVVTGGADKGTYMLGSGPASVFSSWVKLTVPDAPVQSVNGQTGTVNLNAADVQAAPDSHTHSVADIEATGSRGSGSFLMGSGEWFPLPITSVSQAQAQAGTDNVNRHWTALRVRQAIDARAVTKQGAATGLWIGTEATLPTTGTTGVLYVTY